MSKMFAYVLILILLIGIATVAFNTNKVRASGTIYIRSDGSVDPSTAPVLRNDSIYTLTDDISDSSGVVIERDGITFDGAGYTVRGMRTEFSVGILLENRVSVTIKGVQISSFYSGIRFENSSKNQICLCDITNNDNAGIELWWNSNSNRIDQNNVTRNSVYGIRFYQSDNNDIVANAILTSPSVGIDLWESENTTITNNTIGSASTGVDLSSNCVVVNNTIINTGYGIKAGGGSQIVDNTIVWSHYGIALFAVSHVLIVGNNITDNDVGIDEWGSENTIYHNFFGNNSLQVEVTTQTRDSWDDGYPYGGNYWSNYKDTDGCCGPDQNQSGSDGIWDHPYVIDSNNVDRYPLVPEFPLPSIVPIFIMTSLMLTTILKGRRKTSAER